MKTEIKKIGGGIINTFKPLEIEVKLTIPHEDDLQSILTTEADEIFVSGEDVNSHVLDMFYNLIDDVRVFIRNNAELTELAETDRSFSKEPDISQYVRERLQGVSIFQNVNRILEGGKIFMFERVSSTTQAFTKGVTYFGVKAQAKSNYFGVYKPSFMILSEDVNKSIVRFADPSLHFNEEV